MGPHGTQGAWRTDDKGKGVDRIDRIDLRVPRQQSAGILHAPVEPVKNNAGESLLLHSWCTITQGSKLTYAVAVYHQGGGKHGNVNVSSKPWMNRGTFILPSD